MRNAFADEVTKIAAEDSRIVLLSGDIGNRLFDNLRNQFPKQFINCGIAEANMMSVAAGMGLSGLRPIVYTITPFTTTRCLEQIRVGVAYHDSPVIIVGTGSGLSYASLGPTHHSLEDFAILRAIPNLQVLAPWDANSLRVLLRLAIESNKPSYIRIGKKGEPPILPLESVPPIASAVSLTAGTDVCLVAVGTMAKEAQEAAEDLKALGISAEVALIHSIKPWPINFIDSLLQRHSAFVTIEEHALTSGFGEAFVAYLSRKKSNAAIEPLGAPDIFMPFVGSQSFARNYLNINSKSIVRVALNIIKSRRNGSSVIC